MPAELNSVSDSSRRHSPTKRIGSINAGWGGVRWVCVGWSEAVGLRKGRLGQDDTRTHFPPSEDYHGVEVRVCVCVFRRAQGDGAVNETHRSNPRILLGCKLGSRETRGRRVSMCVEEEH